MNTGLLGYPIDHSLSPAIHNAAYRELGLDWEYALYPCKDKAAFAATVAAAKADPAAFVGFNVTTPYKVDAFALCTAHSHVDGLTGSANVLSFSKSATPQHPVVRGDNTDGRGLVAALEGEAGCSLANASVVLCGTGSVALSVLLALLERPAASVSIASRNPEQALEQVRNLCDRFEKARRLKLIRQLSTASVYQMGRDIQSQLQSPEHLPPLPPLHIIGYDEVAAHLEAADVLIDATTVGMHPDDAPVVAPEALGPVLVVLDVVYGHGETALIQAAREAGAQAFDGLGMLIEQAALTIEIWAREQGQQLKAPRTLMRQAALEALAHS